jgi:hypothetical protein
MAVSFLYSYVDINLKIFKFSFDLNFKSNSVNRSVLFSKKEILISKILLRRILCVLKLKTTVLASSVTQIQSNFLNFKIDQYQNCCGFLEDLLTIFMVSRGFL